MYTVDISSKQHEYLEKLPNTSQKTTLSKTRTITTYNGEHRNVSVLPTVPMTHQTAPEDHPCTSFHQGMTPLLSVTVHYSWRGLAGRRVGAVVGGREEEEERE